MKIWILFVCTFASIWQSNGLGLSPEMGNLVNLYNKGRLFPNMISPELYRQVVETDNFRRYLNAGGQDPFPQRPFQNYNMFSFGFPYWNRYRGNFMNPYNVRSGPFNPRAFNPFPYRM